MRLDECNRGHLVLWLRTPKSPKEPQAFVPAVVDAVHEDRITIVVRVGGGRIVKRVVDPVYVDRIDGEATQWQHDVAAGIRRAAREVDQ